MSAVCADVAADLRQLLGGQEHAVAALKLKLQVVAGDARDGLRVEPGKARNAVVLMHDDVAQAQISEAAQHAATTTGMLGLGASTPQEPSTRDDCEPQARGDETIAQRADGELDLALARATGRRHVADPPMLHARKIERGALPSPRCGQATTTR